MNTTITILVLFTSLSVIGQNSTLAIDSTSVCTETYAIVESMPEYPDGEIEFFNFLRQLNLRDYCDYNQLKGITFTINKKGKVSNAFAVGLQGECAEMIEQQILKMQDWTPGYQRGQPVCVKFEMPVRFTSGMIK